MEANSLVARGSLAIAQRRTMEQALGSQNARYRQARTVLFDQVCDEGMTAWTTLFDRVRSEGKTIWTSDESAKLFGAFETLQQLAKEGYGRAYAPLARFYRANWSINPTGKGSQGEVSLGVAEQFKCGTLNDQAIAVHFETVAFEWLYANRDQQDGELWFDLGCCCGFAGPNQDAQQQVFWLYKSAEAGYAPAQFDIAVMMYCGNEEGGLAQDLVEGAQWCRKAADQGHASAQVHLGSLYKNGEGVAQDEIEAAKWFRKAADRGKSGAQAALGMMYLQGLGVVQDFAMGLQWFHKAVEQGDADAHLKLGVSYAEGKGVARNDAEAVKWFFGGAVLGGHMAQFELAEMYAAGRGVAPDAAVALKWYRKSAAQENPLAQDYLISRGLDWKDS